MYLLLITREDIRVNQFSRELVLWTSHCSTVRISETYHKYNYITIVRLIII